MSDDIAPAPATPAAHLPEGPAFRADSWRGGADRHRIGRTAAGAWWWVDPVSGPRVIAGIRGVSQSIGPGRRMARLDQTGFNLLAPPLADAFCNRGMPHLAELQLRNAGERTLRLGGVLLPDVFDPRWKEAARARVEAWAPTAGLAGYVTDAELRWGPASRIEGPLPRPGLLQVCLSLDPDYAAYHSAWEFVLATRGGGMEQLARDWGVPLANKEALRQMTREDEVIDSPAYRLDLERFLREVAQRYHRTVMELVRQADPGRLVFAAPISRGAPTAVREAAATHGDAVLALERGAGGGRAPEILWDLEATAAAGDPAGARVNEPPAVSPLERALRRRREALVEAACDPQCIGFVWGPHIRGDIDRDGPLACGLWDENGRFNHVQAEPLAVFNAAATGLRASATACN